MLPGTSTGEILRFSHGDNGNFTEGTGLKHHTVAITEVPLFASLLQKILLISRVGNIGGPPQGRWHFRERRRRRQCGDVERRGDAMLLCRRGWVGAGSTLIAIR